MRKCGGEKLARIKTSYMTCIACERKIMCIYVLTSASVAWLASSTKTTSNRGTDFANRNTPAVAHTETTIR